MSDEDAPRACATPANPALTPPAHTVRSYLKVTPDADPSQPLDVSVRAPTPQPNARLTPVPLPAHHQIVFECLLALGLLSLASAGLAGDLKQRFAAPDLAKK